MFYWPWEPPALAQNDFMMHLVSHSRIKVKRPVLEHLKEKVLNFVRKTYSNVLEEKRERSRNKDENKSCCPLECHQTIISPIL